MNGQRIILSAETKEIRDLVRNGHLFDVEKWAKNGKSLRRRELDPWKSLLFEAVDFGFHSMVEILLKNDKWQEEELAEAVAQAASNRRLDMVEILLEHGAPVHRIDFREICQTMDQTLVARFLQLGVDPNKHNAFARSLNEHKAKPLLRIYMALREEFPALNRQASLALYDAVREENLRWTSLLAWAGADPLCEVPYNLNEEFDDVEYTTTAAIQSCMRKDASFLRALKIKPDPPVLRNLVFYASWEPCPEIIRYLLKLNPTPSLNDEQSGSCRALEALVKAGKDRFWNRSSGPEYEQQLLECIELLLDHGARWNPPDENLTRARRELGSHKAEYVVQVIRLLLYTPGATDFSKMWKLCSTSKIRALINSRDGPLWSELLELYRANASDTSTKTGTA